MPVTAAPSQLVPNRRLRVGLFVPCYVDQFYPDVGLATVEVLERFGVDVEFPEAQTCCGQPMANAGCMDDAQPLASKFFEVFQGYDYVVAPSGSCVSMVRHHYEDFWASRPGLRELGQRTFELCEFLYDIVGLRRVDGSFPHRVGLHQSCHGLRELGLGPSSELMRSRPSKVRALLETLDGIEFSDLRRPDECCGFGGTFAIGEAAVSVMMGVDRLADHERAGTRVLTAVDMSCLMHLEGLIRRHEKPIHVMHVAQIFAGRSVPRAEAAP